MIPYIPTAIHNIWYRNWRNSIAKAKDQDNADIREVYCRNSVTSQAQYVMALAIKLKERKLP